MLAELRRAHYGYLLALHLLLLGAAGRSPTEHAAGDPEWGVVFTVTLLFPQ
jgi:hypothetical protein